MTDEVTTTEAEAAQGRLARLGPDARVRPTPTLPAALVAAAGALVAIGLIALIAGDNANRGVTALAGAIVAVVGYGIVFAGPKMFRPAGIVGLIIGIPVLFISMLVGDSAGTGAVNGGLLLSCIALLALYFAAPSAVGQTPLLGIAALLFWLVMMNTVADNGFGFSADDVFDSGTSTATSASWMSLMIGAGYLAITWWLDTKNYRGAATAFAATGGIAFIVGVVGVLTELGDGVFVSLLLILASAVLGYVGHRGQRRFTTWTGAVGFFAGAFALATAIANNNARGVGAIALALGVATAGGLFAISNDPDGFAGVAAKVKAAAADRAAAAKAESDKAEGDDQGAAPPPPTAPTFALPTVEEPTAPEASTPAAATVIDVPDATPDDATVLEPSGDPAAVDPAPAAPASTSAYTPDWYPDPHGRFDQRYHNGTVWTAYVARDGEQLTDPDGV